MSKLRMLTVAVVGLLLVNLGLIGFLVLRKPAPPPHNRPEGPRNVIIEKLALTEAQIVRYDQMIAEHQAEIRRLNDEIRKTKNNLYATLASDGATNQDFFISRLGALQRQVESAHYAHFMALKDLCTPDQKDKFNDLTTQLAAYFTPDKRPPIRR